MRWHPSTAAWKALLSLSCPPRPSPTYLRLYNTRGAFHCKRPLSPNCRKTFLSLIWVLLMVSHAVDTLHTPQAMEQRDSKFADVDAAHWCLPWNWPMGTFLGARLREPSWRECGLSMWPYAKCLRDLKGGFCSFPAHLSSYGCRDSVNSTLSLERAKPAETGEAPHIRLRRMARKDVPFARNRCVRGKCKCVPALKLLYAKMLVVCTKTPAQQTAAPTRFLE